MTVLAVLVTAPGEAAAVTNTRDPFIAPADEPKRVGQGLAANDGDWDYESETARSTSRQWLRCDSAGTNCNAAIATGGAYTLTNADVGSTIRLRVTATCDGCVPATEDSPATGVIRTDPSSESPPAILGNVQVGEDLEGVTGSWSGSQPLLFGIQWQQCTNLDSASCVDIPGATGDLYTVRARDYDRRLRVLVTADNGAPGSVVAASAISELVDATVLSPFPLVAIGGEVSARGADLTLLRVRGPFDAIASVHCRGKSCPARRVRRRIGPARVLRFRRFERRLDAGTRIEVAVGGVSSIGKYVRFRIRRNRPPARLDACVLPGSQGPSPCPGA